MTKSEIRDQVTKLNEILGRKPWLDVDIMECTPWRVVLDCGIDLSAGPDLEITFDSVNFVSLVTRWHTDTSQPVLRLMTGQEAYDLNGQYRIEQGHHLIAFQPEDLQDGVQCIIAAKSMNWRVIKPD